MVFIYFFLAVPILIGFGLSGIHQVPQGWVGVYYRFGVLQDEVSGSGYQFMNWMTTRYEPVQVTMQIDEVKDIPCGTSGGVIIKFDKIEVVNQLKESAVIPIVRNYTTNYDKIWIYDKIHHEINQYCSKHTLNEILITKFEQIDEELIKALKEDIEQWAPGIQIISVRVTKPGIPIEIERSFNKIEEVKATIEGVKENGKVLVQQAKAKVDKKVKDVQQKLKIEKIRLQRLLEEKKNQVELSKLENEIFLRTESLRLKKEFVGKEVEVREIAETVNKASLEEMRIGSFLSNSRAFIGKSIPSSLIQQSFDGSGQGAQITPEFLAKKRE